MHTGLGMILRCKNVKNWKPEQEKLKIENICLIWYSHDFIYLQITRKWVTKSRYSKINWSLFICCFRLFYGREDGSIMLPRQNKMSEIDCKQVWAVLKSVFHFHLGFIYNWWTFYSVLVVHADRQTVLSCALFRFVVMLWFA